MACFLLFTGPPFPALPERRVPRFFRRMALLTLLPAALPYLAICCLRRFSLSELSCKLLILNS